jgi:nitrogen fixation/metabolism regulation signal transduction histidine kinase
MVIRHFVLVILVGLIAVACGPDTKKKALQSTLLSVNAARDGFVAWDGSHQQTIVDSATSFQDGTDKLNEYRTKRAQLEIAFAVVYQAVATAAIDLKEENIAVAIEAAKKVYEHIRELMGDSASGLVPNDPVPNDPVPLVPPPATN